MERTIQASPYKHSHSQVMPSPQKGQQKCLLYDTLLHCDKRYPPTGQFGGITPCAAVYCSCSAQTAQCAQPTSPEYEFHVAKLTPDSPWTGGICRLTGAWPGSSNLGAQGARHILSAHTQAGRALIAVRCPCTQCTHLRRASRSYFRSSWDCCRCFRSCVCS
jgi:hypothetical protein